MDNLGSRLKNIRLKAGLTLRELARQADVSPSFVSQIENGKSQPSVATLYVFAQLLNVSIDELFDQRGGEAGVRRSSTAGGPTATRTRATPGTRRSTPTACRSCTRRIARASPWPRASSGSGSPRPPSTPSTS